MHSNQIITRVTMNLQTVVTSRVGWWVIGGFLRGEGNGALKKAWPAAVRHPQSYVPPPPPNPDHPHHPAVPGARVVLTTPPDPHSAGRLAQLELFTRPSKEEPSRRDKWPLQKPGDVAARRGPLRQLQQRLESCLKR